MDKSEFLLLLLVRTMEIRGWKKPDRVGSTSSLWGNGVHWDHRGVTAWCREDGFAIERGETIPPDIPVWGLSIWSAVETLEDYAAGRPRRFYKNQWIDQANGFF